MTLGPSDGAGKTTTIDRDLGLSQPTTGDVDVDGTAPRGAIARRLVSAVMQTGGRRKDLSAPGTVRNHLPSAIGKAGSRTRAEAVAVADGDGDGWL